MTSQRPEAIFITKLLAGTKQDLVDTMKFGFDAALFPDPYKDVIDFILEYQNKYGDIPDKKTVEERFSVLGAEILFTDAVPKAPLRATYDNVVKQSAKADIVKFSEELYTKYEQLDGLQLIDLVVKETGKLTNRFLKSRGRVSSLTELVPDLKANYEEIISGNAVGIPIPFLFLQEMLLGWQPAELTTVVARTGVGKTWFLMMSIIAAAVGDPYFFYRPPDISPLSEERKRKLATRVLVVSCEMPSLDIARRLMSVYAQTSFNRLRSAKLSHEEKELYFRKMSDEAAVLMGNNIRIVGPEIASTPEQILAQAQDFDAALIVIDGFYYMQGPGEQRWEKVQANMQQMRLHSLMSGKHYLLASQFKRDAKTIQSSSTDDLGFSVSIGQDSNNVIGLYQPNALAKAKQLDMKSLKFRDGVPNQPYRFSWDFYNMVFDQIGQVAEDSEEE